MNKIQIINRLKLGRRAAARVSPQGEGMFAFVIVTPVIDNEQGEWTETQPMIEPKVIRKRPGAEPIKGYAIRYQAYDGKEGTTIYLSSMFNQVSLEVDSIEAVELALSKNWGLKLEELILPHHIWLGLEVWD